VSFNPQGYGTAVSDKTGLSSLSIASLPKLVAAGFNFLGWSDSSTGSVLTSDLVLFSDKTLYARWIPEAYQLAFNTKGGSVIPTSSFVAGESLTAPTIPARIGYDFLGWSATDGGSALTFPYTPSVPSDSVLFALWSASTHNVYFETNGGSAVSPSSFVAGGSLTEPTIPARPGFDFVGWSASNGGSAVSFPYTPNVLTDHTLYASWSIKTYAATFDSKGGTPVLPGSFAYRGYLLAPTPPVRVGYTFRGWSATEGSSTLKFPYKPLAATNVNFYAIWSPNTLKVSFDSKGGSTVKPNSFVFGGSIVDKPKTPSRMGYTFVGWSAEPSGNVVSFPYSPAASESITLYAQWAAKNLRVEFKSKVGGLVGYGTTVTGGAVTETPLPTRAGYLFKGWSLSALGGDLLTLPYPHGRTGDFILWAQWTLKP
jgi:uncharacterized repeat protein (TIGR02543 family)